MRIEFTVLVQQQGKIAYWRLAGVEPGTVVVKCLTEGNVALCHGVNGLR